MKLRKFDPRKIVVPKIRVTSRFDPSTLEMLRASMAAEGLIAPIICCELEITKMSANPVALETDQPEIATKVKQLTLVDGLHRLEEAIRLQMPTVDVVVVEGDMVDVLTRNLFMDHLRGKHPPSEMVAVVEELARTYGLGPDDIAKKTGMSREYIENLMLISRLTPMVRAAIDDGSLGLTAAVQLCRLKSPEAQEEYFAYFRQYRWTTAILRDQISERLAVVAAPPPPPAPPTPPQPHTAECVYCRRQFQLAQLSNPTTCIGCFGDMIRSMAMAQAALEQEQAVAADAKAAEKEKPSPGKANDGGA